MDETQLETRLQLRGDFRAEYLLHYRILPLDQAGGVVRVAAAGIPSPEVLDDLRETFDAAIELVPVDGAAISRAVNTIFAGEASVLELVRDLIDDLTNPLIDSDEVLADARDLANQPPVIKLVNLLIREAAAARASDIHFEAARGELRIRFRIDGVLTDVPAPPPSVRAAIVSRVKLMADLDIAERRVPQDGRIRVRLESREFDLRVSTIPALHGESVVLRLLDRAGAPAELHQLGMPPAIFERFRHAANRPHGVVLATGPTGSGKTTTLYATLGLRRPDVEKIVTVEDPVEYKLPGVTQVPVNLKAGLGFPSALRSILRQDPDVLMIGEMRDPETAAIAVQAAMTGHLVLSTVHANHALATIPRLVDLGIEPYLVASTVEGVLAQRLVRRICADCTAPYPPDEAEQALLGRAADAAAQLHRGRGCPACRGTGYFGRIGIFEFMPLTEDLRQLIAKRSDRAAIRETASAAGWRPLADDAWQKVRLGITTTEEVLRVITPQ